MALSSQNVLLDIAIIYALLQKGEMSGITVGATSAQFTLQVSPRTRTVLCRTVTQRHRFASRLAHTRGSPHDVRASRLGTGLAPPHFCTSLCTQNGRKRWRLRNALNGTAEFGLAIKQTQADVAFAGFPEIDSRHDGDSGLCE